MARKTGSNHLKKVCLNHLPLVQCITLRCYHWTYFDTCISPYNLHNHMLSTIPYFSHPRKFPRPLANLHPLPRGNHYCAIFHHRLIKSLSLSLFHMNTCYSIKQESGMLKSIISSRETWVFFSTPTLRSYLTSLSLSVL